MAVRRVRRVIRKIDPWTVLKVSLIFNAIAGLIFVLGVWVMWSLAIQRGIPDQVTEFFANFALVFTPEGELYFRVVVLLTIIMVVALTGLFTLAAVMYNLISDVVGGVEVIVLEETYAMVTARQVPVRPAVHMPATTEVDTVQDEAIVPMEDVEGPEPIDEPTAEPTDEPLDESEKGTAESSEEAAASMAEPKPEPADDDEVAIEEDITVEDDDLPLRAASEG